VAGVVHFIKFILDEIFPAGWLPTVPTVEERAVRAGFKVTRTRSMRPHYARTPDMWAAALEANKDRAIALQSHRVYDRYIYRVTAPSTDDRRTSTLRPRGINIGDWPVAPMRAIRRLDDESLSLCRDPSVGYFASVAVQTSDRGGTHSRFAEC
jgi:hypothetical protein